MNVGTHHALCLPFLCNLAFNALMFSCIKQSSFYRVCREHYGHNTAHGTARYNAHRSVWRLTYTGTFEEFFTVRRYVTSVRIKLFHFWEHVPLTEVMRTFQASEQKETFTKLNRRPTHITAYHSRKVCRASTPVLGINFQSFPLF